MSSFWKVSGQDTIYGFNNVFQIEAKWWNQIPVGGCRDGPKKKCYPETGAIKSNSPPPRLELFYEVYSPGDHGAPTSNVIYLQILFITVTL